MEAVGVADLRTMTQARSRICAVAHKGRDAYFTRNIFTIPTLRWRLTGGRNPGR
jgi:hypothetical protein